MKFLAAILVEHNQPLVIDEIELAQPVGVGQVLVRVSQSGICGAQLGEQAGVKGPDKYMPHLLGHEGAGVVEEIGPGVSQVIVGDHVVMHWRQGPGINSLPPRYRWRGKEIGGGWVTTFNQYAVVSENRLTKIAKSIPFDIAALMGCAVTTALGVISYDAQLKLGQSVAVLGCGGVGLNIIQAARLAGAYPIIGIDLFQQKRELAIQFGATHTLDNVEALAEFTGLRGADVFVETTGNGTLIEQAYHYTASDGKTILVGQMRYDHKASIQTLPMHGGKLLLASEGGQTLPARDIPRYIRLWQAGRLKLEELITHRTTLPLINGTFDQLRAGNITGRCVIDLEGR